MTRNALSIEAPQALTARHCSRPLVRTPHADGGFFTIGFTVAVLAVASLFAGTVGVFDAAPSASAAKPAVVAGERAEPAAEANTDGVDTLAASDAPSASPSQASGDTASAQ